MVATVGSATSVPHTRPAPVAHSQVKAGGKDSDGDNDGSKAGEVEMPKAAYGTIGTVVNTKA